MTKKMRVKLLNGYNEQLATCDLAVLSMDNFVVHVTMEKVEVF